jgi:hypothetical protein
MKPPTLKAHHILEHIAFCYADSIRRNRTRPERCQAHRDWNEAQAIEERNLLRIFIRELPRRQQLGIGAVMRARLSAAVPTK